MADEIWPPHADPDFEKSLMGYRLTTAHILYRMPDHPALLQEFIWQELDKIPNFPVLKNFLNFWEREIEGKLYRVKIAAVDTIKPAQLRLIGQELLVE